jgi:hypothetical protein
MNQSQVIETRIALDHLITFRLGEMMEKLGFGIFDPSDKQVHHLGKDFQERV